MTDLAGVHASGRDVSADPAPRMRFNLRELAGSLGDMGTFLPLVLATAAASGMDLGTIFIFAGLMNVLTGFWFGQPIPVQPMKAIAAVAVTEGLTHGEIAAGGVFLGIALVLLAMSGAMEKLSRAVPLAVVRGIQVGIGVKLAWSGLTTLAKLPPTGLDSLAVAAACGLAIVVAGRYRWAALLAVFAAGVAIAAVTGSPTAAHWLAWPRFGVAMPSQDEVVRGIQYAGILQLPLTLLNSVIAVCALSADYFPGRGIPPRRMGMSVGLMNLLSVPLGGLPMCHGAGGLAAQHHFGARTGGSVVMLGGFKILAGLLLAGVLASGLAGFPKGVLGVMVIVAGAVLAWTGRDCLRGRRLIVLAATVLPILLWSPLYGVLIGLAAAWVVRMEKPAHAS